MPITIVSSDGPEALAAAVPPDSPPPESVPSPGPPAAATPAGAAPDAESAPAVSEDDEPSEPPESAPEQPTRPTRSQRRWDRLTQETEALKRQNQDLQAQMAFLARQVVAPQAQAPAPVADPAGEPQEAQYPSYEAWQSALIDYRVREHLGMALYAREQQERQHAAQQAQAQARQTYEAHVAAARQQYADFEDVLAQSQVRLPPVLQEALVQSEVGGHLTYHLAKYPQDLERLVQLPPAQALRELGRVEARYLAGDTAPAAQASPAASRPPPPPQPVTGGSDVAPTVYRETASQRDYEAWRQRTSPLWRRG